MVPERIADGRSDEALADAVRSGEIEAFAALYTRYSLVAGRFARQLIGREQGVDDLVSEAFAKVLDRLVIGGGPTTAFGSYLLTTIRTTHYKQLAADRIIDWHAEWPEPTMIDADPLMNQLDHTLATRAFRTLSPRWRAVLWHMEVENMSAAQVAALLGIGPNAVAALAFRARDALRVAYLQMHVNTNTPNACKETATNLVAWLCGRLQRGVRYRVEQHIDGCARCTNAAAELSDLVTQLRRMVPLMVSEPNCAIPASNVPGQRDRARTDGFDRLTSLAMRAVAAS